jgi:hypothetical protein
VSCSKLIVGSLLVAGCVGEALACGPGFPWELLKNRDRTVVTRVALSFPLKHLVLWPRKLVPTTKWTVEIPAYLRYILRGSAEDPATGDMYDYQSPQQYRTRDRIPRRVVPSRQPSPRRS